MAVIADVLAGSGRASRDRSATEALAHAAWLGTCLLLLVAPFEGLRPFVRLPGQSLSTVETCLLAVLAAWLAASGCVRAAPVWRTALTYPWIAFVGAALVASAAADDRLNALRMTGRFGVAFGVYLLTVNGIVSAARVRSVVAAAALAGAAVASLAMLEYADVEPVVRWLRVFRADVARVGAQVRAGGPFQYPTIASMYLEIVFALTLGLSMRAFDAGRRGIAAVLAIALVAMAQAITLTFTRAGLLTMASSLAIVAALRVHRRGVDRGLALIGLLAMVGGAQWVTSRSVESLRLRMTTEGQATWYHARIDAPSDVALQASGVATVPVRVSNTGSSSWDRGAGPRFRVSYHWLLADEDRVVSWEGARTDLPAVVAAGDTVDLRALVVAPPEPGQYRLLWDVEQEHRRWFSTEPDAQRFFSRATVSGPAAGSIDRSQLATLPARAARPGRFVLWSAAGRMLADHPILGVGPDNFRLQYGGYAGLPGADPRVHSNNMYLEVLTGGGLAAGLAFLWLMWSAGGQTLAMARSKAGSATASLSDGIVAAVAAIALHGLVDTFLGFTATYIVMAIALGLLTGCHRLHQDGHAHAHRV